MRGAGRRRRTASAAVVVAALLALPVARAAGGVDAVAVEAGSGNEETARVGLAAQWYWPWQWFTGGSWYLTGLWEASASYWDGDDGRTGNDTLGDFGFTPVFRLERRPLGGFTPYLEAAVGLHLFTDTGIGNRDFDINFSFGDHLGVGVRGRHWELAYRFQHLSNASLGDSNPGINFHLVRLGYRF